MSNIVHAMDLIPQDQYSDNKKMIRSKRLTQSQLDMSTRSLSSSSHLTSSIPQKSLMFLTRRRTFTDMQITTPDYYNTALYNSIQTSTAGQKIGQKIQHSYPKYPSPGRYKPEKSSLSKQGGTIDKFVEKEHLIDNPGVGEYDITAYQTYQTAKKHGSLPQQNDPTTPVTPGPADYSVSASQLLRVPKISTSRDTLPVTQQVFGDLAKSGPIQFIAGNSLSHKNGVIPKHDDRFSLPETKNNPAPYDTRQTLEFLRKENGVRRIGEKTDRKISSEEVSKNLQRRKQQKKLNEELQYKNYQQMHNKVNEK